VVVKDKCPLKEAAKGNRAGICLRKLQVSFTRRVVHLFSLTVTRMPTVTRGSWVERPFPPEGAVSMTRICNESTIRPQRWLTADCAGQLEAPENVRVFLHSQRPGSQSHWAWHGQPLPSQSPVRQPHFPDSQPHLPPSQLQLREGWLWLPLFVGDTSMAESDVAMIKSHDA
jgi:hypothetical protein